jgi:hypothetical protein
MILIFIYLNSLGLYRRLAAKPSATSASTQVKTFANITTIQRVRPSLM